eukprot:943094-Heterocapsa_arctica.AAC.1
MKLSSATFAKIVSERQESEGMMRLLCDVLELLLYIGQRSMYANMVHVAYEWPRGSYSSARRVPSMQCLLNMLPHSCMLDGCMYGLRCGFLA